MDFLGERLGPHILELHVDDSLAAVTGNDSALTGVVVQVERDEAAPWMMRYLADDEGVSNVDRDLE
jgi:hypothetical protein